MSRIYIIVALFLITSGKSEAFFDYNENSISLGMRTYPFSATVDGQLKFEKLFWDQREKAPYKFGMMQTKLTLASHALAEVAVSIFPVGFLELGVNTSTTSRFYETKNFDCTLVACQGVLARSALFGRMIIGHQFSMGQLFALLAASQARLTISDDSKPFVDEVEKLLGQAGGDEFTAQSAALGMRRSEDMFLILHRQGQFKNTRDKSEQTYLVYRTQMDEYRISAGLGQYQSNRFKSDFSAVLGVSVADGATASLF